MTLCATICLVRILWGIASTRVLEGVVTSTDLSASPAYQSSCLNQALMLIEQEAPAKAASIDNDLGICCGGGEYQASQVDATCSFLEFLNGYDTVCLWVELTEFPYWPDDSRQ